MADVAAPFGTLGQLAVIARLRALIFRNSIRTTSERLNLIAYILLSIVITLFSLSFGIGIAFASYISLATGNLKLLTLLFWGLFLAWHFLPILFSAYAADFDFRTLLRFPLRFLTFYLLSLAYGLFDPALLSCVFWLLCLGTGAALARPDLVPTLLLVILVFGITNLLLARLISSWLERLLARRRTREALIVLFLLSMFSLQFFGLAGERWARDRSSLTVKVSPYLRPLPPGLAALSIERAFAGHTLPALTPSALLAVYGVLFGWLLRRRLLAQYRGEDLGESLAPSPSTVAVVSTSSTSSSSFASFSSSFLPGPVAAMFEKEIHYLLRNFVMLLTLAAPVFLLILIVSAGQSPRASQRTPFPFATSDYLFPSAVGYAFLILTNLLHNCFGYAGYGMQLLLAAPVRFREILLGVNLAQTVLVLFETALITVSYSLFFHPPALPIFLATLAMLGFLLVVNLTAGNLLSLYRPRRIEFGSLRRQQASGMTVLIGLGVQIACFIVIGLVFLVTHFFGGSWAAVFVFALLTFAAAQVYRSVLERCSRIAVERREFLTAEFCRSS